MEVAPWFISLSSTFHSPNSLQNASAQILELLPYVTLSVVPALNQSGYISRLPRCLSSILNTFRLLRAFPPCLFPRPPEVHLKFIPFYPYPCFCEAASSDHMKSGVVGKQLHLRERTGTFFHPVLAVSIPLLSLAHCL